MKKPLLLLSLLIALIHINLVTASFYTNIQISDEKYLLYEDFTKYTDVNIIMNRWDYYSTDTGILKLTSDGLEIGYDASGSHKRFKIRSPSFTYDPTVGVTLVALVKTGTSLEHDLEVFYYFGDGYYGGIGAHGYNNKIRWYYRDSSGRWYDKDFSPRVSLHTNTWYLFVIRLKSSEIKFEVYSWNNGNPQLLGVGSLHKQTPEVQNLRITLGAHNDKYNPPYQYGTYKIVYVVQGFDTPIDKIVEGVQNTTQKSELFMWKYFIPRTQFFPYKYKFIESKDGATTPITFKEYTHTIIIHNNLDYDVPGYQTPIELTETSIGDNFLWTCEGCIKIVDSNGEEVPYYIDEWDAGNKHIKLIVKINLKANDDTILTIHSSTKYISKSSPEEVFDLYDEFNSLDEDLWNISGTNNDYAQANTQVKNGYVKMYTNNGGWVTLMSIPQFRATQQYGYKLEFSYSIKGDIGGQGTAFLGFAEPQVPGKSSWSLTPSLDNTGLGEGWCKDWGICTETCNNGARTGEYSGLKMSSTSTEYTYNVEIIWLTTKVRIQFERGGTVITKEYTTNIPDKNMVVWFGVDDNNSSYGGLTLKIHWVRVRKVIPIEPTVTIT